MQDFKIDAESKPDFTPVFIHSALDDYGLSQSQFRVICRIARRGECYEKGPEIAKGCKMNPDTIWPALKFLVARNLVKKIKRPGTTSVFVINPVSVWMPPITRIGYWEIPTGKEGVASDGSHPLFSSTGYRKTGGTHPLEKSGYKGNPSEVNPIKVFAVPVFAPVRLGMFSREYDAMLEDAREQLKKAQKAFTEKVLTDAARSFIDWVEANETDPKVRADEIKTAEADGQNYTRGLTPEGKNHERCWLNRIEEIKRAKRGELSTSNPRNIGVAGTAAEKTADVLAVINRQQQSFQGDDSAHLGKPYRRMERKGIRENLEAPRL